MNVKRWVARRETNWQQLDKLLRQAERRGLRSLSAAQVRELASLYRSVSGDLARARTQQVGPHLIADLQHLVARGYNQIYQGSRRQGFRGAAWGAGVAGHFSRWRGGSADCPRAAVSRPLPPRRRPEALRRPGRAIEGFFSPNPAIPDAVKIFGRSDTLRLPARL